jgi:A/G-specific adenine glycosylase
VPSSVEVLSSLPGIGPYTARAVAASAFGRPVAPLDVNVRRVVARVAGMPPTDRDLQATADALVARRDPRRWVDAVMDLAATVCLRRAPACAICPLQAMCRSAYTPGEPARRSAAPIRFEATNRWLRGRLLGMVRDAPAGTWTPLPGALGEHDAASVRAAVDALAREGFLDVEGDKARLRAG